MHPPILQMGFFTLLFMTVFDTIRELKPALNLYKDKGQSVGFVPTMGALHKGHLSLAEKAAAENETVVVSIFVNPTQFNNADDLEKYPRTLKEDLDLLAGLKGIENRILVYAPQAADIYQDGVVSENFDFDGLENEMEGKFRNGHFDGVGTVVKRFFTMIEPDNAYFGEKDFQQLQIIKKMVAKENLPVKIISCPVYREASGLAMSSRNKRLNKNQLDAAPLIYTVLKQVKNDFGVKSAAEISAWVSRQFENNPELVLEYFEIADEETLKSLQTEKLPNTDYRAFIAVFAGDVRLIDTISLSE